MLVFQSIPQRLSEHALHFTPERLAAHIRDVALCQIDGRPDICTPEEVGFQAGWYRWLDVRAELENAERDGIQASHPQCEVWKQDRGLILAGNTIAEQLNNLFRQPAFLRPREYVIHGQSSPSRIADAVTRLSTASDWTSQLEDALDFLDFGSYMWPLEHVTESIAGKPAQEG